MLLWPAAAATILSNTVFRLAALSLLAIVTLTVFVIRRLLASLPELTFGEEALSDDEQAAVELLAYGDRLASYACWRLVRAGPIAARNSYLRSALLAVGAGRHELALEALDRAAKLTVRPAQEPVSQLIRQVAASIVRAPLERERITEVTGENAQLYTLFKALGAALSPSVKIRKPKRAKSRSLVRVKQAG